MRHTHDQCLGGQREHGRAETRDKPQRQDLPVRIHERDQEGRASDDEQAREVDRTGAKPIDEPARPRRRQQPSQREDGDHRAGRGHGHAEAARELREDRGDEPVAEGDDERGADKDPDRARDLRLGAGRLLDCVLC